MAEPDRRSGVEEAPALPIAPSAFATFDAWVVAIDEVAQGDFVEEGWQDGIDSMLDVTPEFDDLDQ